jgi:hypothetical protein
VIDDQFLETPWYGSRQMMRHRRGMVIYKTNSATNYPSETKYKSAEF